MASEQAFPEKAQDMLAPPSHGGSPALKHFNEYALAKMEQMERDRREQKKTEEKQRAQAARLSEKAMATVPRAKDMGIKEVDHQLDKVNKAVFDLKLASYYDRKNLESSEKKLNQAQEDHKALLNITEEMILELERKDEDIREAVALIYQLEDKIKSLESIESSSVPVNTSKRQALSPPSPPSHQPLTDGASSILQKSKDNLDVPGLRPPSSLSQKSSFRSSNTLRDIYLERQKFNTSRISTLSDSTSIIDNERALNEKMSILSISSFGGMYGSVKESISALKETQQRMTSILDDEESEPETPTPAHSVKEQSSIDDAFSIASSVRKASGRDTPNTSVSYKSRGSRDNPHKSSNVSRGSTTGNQYSTDRGTELPPSNVASAKARAHKAKEAPDPVAATAPSSTQKHTFSERAQSRGLSTSQGMPPPTLVQLSAQSGTVTPKTSHSSVPTPTSSSHDLASSKIASRKPPPPSITPKLPQTEASPPAQYYSTPTTPSSGPLTSHPFTPTQASHQNSSTSSLNSRRGRPPSVRGTPYRPQETYPDSPPVSRGLTSVSKRGGMGIETLSRSSEAFTRSDDSLERYLSESPPLISDYTSPLKRFRPPKSPIALTPDPLRRPNDVLTPPSTSSTQLRVSDFDSLPERRAAKQSHAVTPPIPPPHQIFYHERPSEPPRRSSELRRNESRVSSSHASANVSYDYYDDAVDDGAPEHGPGSHPPTKKWGLGGMVRRGSVKISQGLKLKGISRRRESFGGK